MKELVLALDVLDKNLALEVAKKVADYVDRIKVNYPLTLSAGIEVIGNLAEIKPVIADFKVADIPYTSSLIAEIVFKAGAESIIVHGFVGSDTVRAVLGVAEKYSGKVYVVTELSSPGGEEFMAAHSLKITEMAKNLGCHGLIAPATRIDKLAKIREVAGKLEILCPGIGAQKGSLEAIKYCDGIIVGRSIYASDDVRKAAEEFRRVLNEF